MIRPKQTSTTWPDIWKAYTFQILTDTYGDIPYFEAGKGYPLNITYPKYDKQQDIYNDLLNELEQASAALDASKPIETKRSVL